MIDAEYYHPDLSTVQALGLLALYLAAQASVALSRANCLAHSDLIHRDLMDLPISSSSSPSRSRKILASPWVYIDLRWAREGFETRSSQLAETHSMQLFRPM